MTQHPLRFGVWALVQGSWASYHHPDDPPDASWERNKNLILEAEKLGFDSTLVAQHTINPRGDGYDQLEAWASSAALAALTEKIEIITAIKPYLYHPVVLAKMALQIEEISKGRFALNFVNAWFKPELDRAGIGFAEHDERYAYGGEWLEIVRRLINGERVNFQGKHFKVEDYEFWPKDQFRRRPVIYAGGESEPARDHVTKHGDVWFINSQPLEDVKAMIADVARRPRIGPPLRYGLAGFVIARETDKEAEEALAYAFELEKKDAAEAAKQRANSDSKAVMLKTSAKSPRIGTNGGTSGGFVGSYDRVAERMRQFHEAGIELLMLQFQPFEAEMRRFAREVMPRVRKRLNVAA